MILPIDTDGCVLPVSDTLKQILNDLATELIQQPDALLDHSGITFNFRDPDYSPERGGYHPVEIRLRRQGDVYRFEYFTDFAWVGQGWDTELAKELDFDLTQGCFQLQSFQPVPIAESVDIFESFQRNLIAYYEMDVFNVSVKLDEA